MEPTMKFSTPVILFAACASTSIACAQSSVTLFGVADTAVRSTSSGGASAQTIGSGGYAASRYGLRTQEDLGGGLAAGAWLEGTVNFNDGSGNSSRYWNRRSTVSLLGSLGELRIGHDLTPGYTSFGEFDVFGVSGLADQGKFYSTAFGSGIEATGLWARADNMVSYFTPADLGGFYANVAVAAGNATPAKKYSGARIGYANQTLNVTAAYSVFDGLAGDLKRTAIAGSYNSAGVTLMASAVRNTYLTASRWVTQIGGMVPVGPGRFRMNYTWANNMGSLNGSSIGKDDATQLAVGYVYDLSKRTTLYATYVNLRNQGNANFAVSTPPSVAGGQASRGTEFGISHRF